MNRQEHLDWCKQRAIAYVDMGDMHNAFASMASDLSKHPETKNAQTIINTLGMTLLLGGHLKTPDQMRAFINGFN